MAETIMEPRKIKLAQYAPWAGAILSLIFAFAAGTFSFLDKIQLASTTNLIQDQRIQHLEQDDEKNTQNFNQLRSEMNSGFEKVYQILIDIQRKKEG